jgi:type III restriction enzyme
VRLYRTDPVWITYEQTRRYYPDFIVIDSSSVQWLVEVKGDDQLTDATVLAKSVAAEEWAARATDAKLFGVWQYLLVSEKDIKLAANWEALVAR